MENTNRTTITVGVVALVIIIGIMIYVDRVSGGPGKYDGFAQCLKDKGSIFYGASWCPHCQNQKNLFGSSKKYLPYVECSTPNGRGQLPICSEKGIRTYPTWYFGDMSSTTGEISLAVLAERSGCQLPQ